MKSEHITPSDGCVMCELGVCKHKGERMKSILLGIAIGMATSWYLFGPRVFSSDYDLSLSEGDYAGD